MPRALVSHVPLGFETSAQSVCDHLGAAFPPVQPRDDSRAEHFWSAAVRSAKNVNGARSIEDFDLVVHFAHGGTDEFLVSQTNDESFANVAVAVRELGPGSVSTRYLWLVACNCMAHGWNPSRPDLYRGDPGEPSVFRRWGGTYALGSGASSPLGEGVRMVCGGSTVLVLTPSLFPPIFRMIATGFIPLADAFILGLATAGTPLCATLATAATNPLSDRAWATGQNTPGDRIFIQYPGGARSAPARLPEGYDPLSLPLLTIGPARDTLAAIERSIDELCGKEAFAPPAFGEDQILLRPRRGLDTGEIDAARRALPKLLLEAARGTVGGTRGRLTADDNQVSEGLALLMDSYPLEEVPNDDRAPLRLDSLEQIEKPRYAYATARFRDEERPDASYDVLDPDLRGLLRYDAQPGVPVGDVETGRELLIRGLSFVEQSTEREIPLIGVERAEAEAWERVTGRGVEAATDLIRDGAEIAIGYRFQDGRAPPARLVPQYVVSYSSRLGAAGRVSVEVPARDPASNE